MLNKDLEQAYETRMLGELSDFDKISVSVSALLKLPKFCSIVGARTIKSHNEFGVIHTIDVLVVVWVERRMPRKAYFSLDGLYVGEAG